MAERRYYRVADLSFCIIGSEEQMALLSNYEPFRLPDTQDDASLLFSVKVEVANPEFDQLKHVFTDSSDDDMPRIEVYRVLDADQPSWLIRESLYKDSPICMQIYATHDFHQAMVYIVDSSTAKFAIDNAAMLLYAFTTATLGVLEMHASVSVKDNKGFLFLGKSGTGKSTHSRLWHEAFGDKVTLLNDDNPILRYFPVQDAKPAQVIVYGSPWSGKTPCYKNLQYPVGGIVKLSQAPHNEIRAIRLPEAYAYMLSSASGLKIEPKMMDALYETIANIIQTVQLHLMECLPNTDAAILSEKTINVK